MEITEIFNYLNDLLHDPVQGALTIVLAACGDVIADKIKSKSNKRTAPKAGKRKGGSKRKK
ncbi:hypothetical protein PDK22_26075 [Bacillus cereus group sp. BY122LC]|uniref:hypothetical protein n=1 Tax=Bacillus cereus group sp. BY122LC TaxID=3018085 RepID=UPI0022E12D99|nr:hypothetical protein [Bacillus cereus group sp. BY122LC]MDA1861157.1 hypothetical protein [Bacillus cereus group sp. BY122LC]